jgi:hypothetical protein
MNRWHSPGWFVIPALTKQMMRNPVDVVVPHRRMERLFCWPYTKVNALTCQLAIATHNQLFFRVFGATPTQQICFKNTGNN